MFDNLLITDLLKNPIILGAIFALIRNIGGYIYNCIEAKKILPYSASDLLFTLGLWETLFILLSGGANLPTNWTTAITLAIDVIRGFREAIKPQAPVAPTA